MQKMFKMFDKTKSGYILFDELYDSFKHSNTKLSKEEIKILFKELDVDCDNKINYKEFV